ncbi:hypothetical protein ACSTKT_02755 [Vibrio parahaemolyticus]
MKSIFLIAVSISTPCLANFDGSHETNRGNGQFFKTHYTTSDNNQFHIGCGIGDDKKGFTIIGLKHPRLYAWYGVSDIELAVDGGQKIKIEGGTKRYDDMYYAKNPPKEVLEQIFNGNSVEVLLFNREERVTFSLNGSKAIYNSLWERCMLPTYE